jgi:spermidine synthase
MEKGRRMALSAIFVAIGAASMIIQAVVIREFLVVFYGNELMVGMVLAMWLFSIAVGTALYRVLSKRLKAHDSLFSLLTVFFMLLPFAEIALIRSARLLLSVQPGTEPPFLPSSLFILVATLPFGLLIGALFPLGCQIFSRTGSAAGTVAHVYGLESLGALAGGALFSFVLVTSLTPSVIFIATALIFVLLLIWYHACLAAFKNKALLTLFFVICIAGALTAFPAAQRFDLHFRDLRWKSLVGGLPLLASCDSPYQNLAMTGQEELYSLYGNGQLALSFPDPYSNRMAAHLMVTGHQSPSRILIIGACSGGFISECLTHHPQHIDYVLFDRAMLSIMSPYLGSYDREGLYSSKVRIITTDGRFWVRRAEAVYDLVILMVPDPSTAMLNRFYTAEFFRDLKRIMAPDGVLVFSLSSSANYIGPETSDYQASVYTTLHSVFPYIEISPGDRYVYFAGMSREAVTSDPAELSRRLMKQGVPEQQFPAALFDDLFNSERVEEARRVVERPGVALNTDMKPGTYFYNLVRWDRMSGACLAPFFAAVRGVNALILAGILVALMLARLLITTIRREPEDRRIRFNLRFAVAVFGFSSMALEVVLLFAFQNVFGYLYQMIGVLVASFMAGMALGAMLARRAGREFRLLIAVQLMLAVFSLGIPLFLTFFSGTLSAKVGVIAGEMIFMAIMAFMGLGNGLGFPLACRLYTEKEEEIGGDAALLNAFDHGGAACGSVLIGTFFVPLLGIAQSCMFIALVNAAAALLWIGKKQGDCRR